MSLSGIFDPVVRAYFKKHFSEESSGGAPDDSGLGGFVLTAPVDVSSLPKFEYQEENWYKLNDTPFTVSQMDGGFILVGVFKLTLTTDDSVLGESGYGILLEEDGAQAIIDSGSGSLAALSLPAAVAEQIGFPSGGFWLGESSQLGNLDFWLVCKPTS